MVSPSNIYISREEAGEKFQTDYEEFFAAVVDCGWAESVERIYLSANEMMRLTPEELTLLGRFVQETARNHHNTTLWAEDTFDRGLLVVIEHVVPCITTMGSDGAASTSYSSENSFNGKPDSGPLYDHFMWGDDMKFNYGSDDIQSAFHMYNRYGAHYTIRDAAGRIWDGIL